MNKELKVIQSNIAPLNTNHLWLNTDTNTIYKFGANGWEVINNAPYIVEEFTFRDIMVQSQSMDPKLTISRAFLDAMYKGVPIMVNVSLDQYATIPITVNLVDNPNQYTSFQFKVKYHNIEFKVTYFEGEVITGNKALSVAIDNYNLIDWNENRESNTGYIANRTHHLGAIMVTGRIGQRISVSRTGAHYVDNYKLLYDGKLYDLPPSPGETVGISNYFEITFNGVSVNNKTTIYTFISRPISGSLPSQTFGIVSNIEDDGYKALDEFYLPDGAKPWRYIAATRHAQRGNYMFNDINSADIANGENVLRNKVIYQVGSGQIVVPTLSTTSILEFKIKATCDNNIIITGEHVWENGEKPNVSIGDVIYSFLMMGGITYVSAKVYRAV